MYWITCWFLVFAVASSSVWPKNLLFMKSSLMPERTSSAMKKRISRANVLVLYACSRFTWWVSRVTFLSSPFVFTSTDSISAAEHRAEKEASESWLLAMDRMMLVKFNSTWSC